MRTHYYYTPLNDADLPFQNMKVMALERSTLFRETTLRNRSMSIAVLSLIAVR